MEYFTQYRIICFLDNDSVMYCSRTLHEVNQRLIFEGTFQHQDCRIKFLIK